MWESNVTTLLINLSIWRGIGISWIYYHILLPCITVLILLKQATYCWWCGGVLPLFVLPPCSLHFNVMSQWHLICQQPTPGWLLPLKLVSSNDFPSDRFDIKWFKVVFYKWPEIKNVTSQFFFSSLKFLHRECPL